MKNYTLLIISIMFISVSLFGQDGTLDGSFDTDGIVTTSIPGSINFGMDVAIQTDGKIVAAGYTLSNITEYDFTVVRYLSDGSLDVGFGTDGIVVTAVSSKDDQAFGVAIQSDGKIVVAGYTTNRTNNNDFALVRYNSDGSLDNTFDSDGIVTTIVSSITDDDVVYDVAIQSDGKIVVVGVSENGGDDDFAVVRYNSDGSLDGTFNTTGIVLTDFTSYNDEGRSIAIQSDGKIVVFGTSVDGAGHRNFATARYSSTGALDVSNFGAAGKVTTTIGSNYADGKSVAIQQNGKIVVAGTADDSDGNDDIAIVRYETNGALDVGFGSSGVTYANVGSVNTRMHGDGLVIQSDGKIVVVGEINDRGGDITVIRYNTNGSPDLSFSGDGVVTTDITPNSTEDGYGVVIQQDGKIVVVGTWFDSSLKNVFAVLRYNNPSLPVELTSFTSTSVSSATTVLTWTTATEVNNYGFEIERASTRLGLQTELSRSAEGWKKIGFVEGHGNSNSPKDYSFIDSDISVTERSRSYRLKQIDIDGAFEYSDIITVTLKESLKYKLAQNYPNPFNPTTNITFTIPETKDRVANVKLVVSNILGEKIATLVNKPMSAGVHSVTFNASNLPSGIYFYSISINGVKQVKKMNLIK